MSVAMVHGHPATLDEAATVAAEVLGRSRRAAIAGLDADIAAIEAAIGLARRLDGVADHRASRATLRDLDVMRTAGWITTTPLQARARADLIVLVGPDLEQDWPGMEERLALAGPPPLFPDRPRTVIRLCPGATNAPGEVFGADPAGLAALLGQVRAAVGGRRLPPGGHEAARCAGLLAAASYGVIVWSASRIDGLVVEMICGLVDALNARTRFAGLPIPAAGNAAGAAQACAWLTGFPLPVGFEGGVASHDPWRFDATRLLGSGEADAMLWLCTGDAAAPAWASHLPVVAICAAGAAFATPPQVAFTVGRAGIDHGGVVYDTALGGLVHHAASAPSDAPRASDVIARIAALVEDRSC
jgi:formylmethanofuran dehydrogenase subunit B